MKIINRKKLKKLMARDKRKRETSKKRASVLKPFQKSRKVPIRKDEKSLKNKPKIKEDPKQ